MPRTPARKGDNLNFNGAKFNNFKLKYMIEKILKKHLGNFKIDNVCGYSPTCGTTLRTLTVYHMINGKSCHCIRYATLYGWQALKKSGIYLETVKELQQLDYENMLDELEQIKSNLN